MKHVILEQIIVKPAVQISETSIKVVNVYKATMNKTKNAYVNTYLNIYN